jgi:phospholipase D1/2
MLTEAKTVWRLANAHRVSVLNGGAAFFGTLRRCLLAAQRSVFIVGWDIHSETRLVGPSGKASDGWPERLAELLEALLARRPDLKIYLLIWRSPILYAGEREWFPTLKFGKAGNERLKFCLDGCLPIGSAQHQKIVVVDDAVAFVGGCDLTIRRWDTCAHLATSKHRIDPYGVPYPPFHDVEMIVDGEAARNLAQLARYRWSCANCEETPPIAPTEDLWPAELVPDFQNVVVGIARTEPGHEGEPAITEVEQLFLASINAAEQIIYIENQFLSSETVATALVRRMRDRPALEVLLIAPKTHASWLEARTMRNGRLAFMKVFEDAGLRDRVLLLYPETSDENATAAVMVHSKVMIVDDRILRVGSANLNNRSMGADSECDLVIEARTDAERDRIAEIRNMLLGTYCGISAAAIREQLTSNPSLLRIAATVSSGGYRLRPVEDGRPDPAEITQVVTPVADPPRPLGLERAATATFRGSMKIIVLILAICLLGGSWRFPPLDGYTDSEMLLRALQSFQGSPNAPFIAIAAFVLGGFILFPVTVLIAVTAAALGPLLGFSSAAIGVLTSASVVYAIGRAFGLEPIKSLLGPRLSRIQQHIVGNGVMAVALVRMLPVAPFSLVNIAAGAMGIRFVDFIIGTFLGMAPGLLALSAFGAQIADLLVRPTWSSVVILLLCVSAWVLFSIAAQFVVTRLSRHS